MLLSFAWMRRTSTLRSGSLVTTGLWIASSGCSSTLSASISSRTAFALMMSTSTSQITSSSPATLPRAAIAQLCSTSDKVSNLLQIAKCAGWAQRGGASMLFLPECFGFMGESADQTLQQAEPAMVKSSEHSDDNNTFESPLRNRLRQVISEHASNDEQVKSNIPETRLPDDNDDLSNNIISVLDALKWIAQDSGLWISGGGMHVADAPPHPTSNNPRVYNTHVILDNQGKVQCFYGKIHLFDVSIPGKVELRESNTTAPGTELVVCDSPIGRLGLSTCYDMRFGEMYLQLVEKGGAQILLMPSAFTVPTGSAHWHTLLRARAIENQCYVLAAAQYGRHNTKRESYGHSLAIDPWGQVVADAGGYDGPGTTTLSDPSRTVGEAAPSVIFCAIDLDHMESIRQRMPIQQHRESSSFSF